MRAADVLAEAAADRSSGARVIASRAADGIALLAEEHGDPDELAPEFLKAARVLMVNQGMIGSLWNLINDCLIAADEAEGPELAADAVAGAAQSFRTRAKRAIPALIHELAPIVPQDARITTTSASATLEEAFVAMAGAGKLRQLYCTRSLPGGEGVDMAERLRDHGLRVTVIDDACLTNAVADSDLVLFGADSMGPDFLVNKVGTRQLALVARAFGIDTYVVAENAKVVPPMISDVIYARLDRGAATGRFEAVPWREIRGWVSEDGLVSARSVDVIASRVELHLRVEDLARDLVESLRLKSDLDDPATLVGYDSLARAHHSAEAVALDDLFAQDLGTE